MSAHISPLPVAPAGATLYNITTDAGKILHPKCTLDDAHRIIDVSRREPERYPEWQDGLRVKAILDSDRLRSRRAGAALTYGDGLPLDGRNAMAPALHFTGTNLGLGGDEPVVVNVASGTWSASLTVELALFHLDDFVDGHRARLIGVAGAHFGVQLVRGAA